MNSFEQHWPLIAIIGIIIVIFLVFSCSEEDEQDILPESQEVKCEVCKHKIDKIDAQQVEYQDHSSYLAMFYASRTRDRKKYYCPMHKVKYEVERDIELGEVKYYINVPATVKEVDIKGEEIKKNKSF